MTIPGLPNPGNPAIGQQRFFGTAGPATDGNVFCVTCHQAPFGANGGKLGGLAPGDPPQAKAALFNGNLDLSPHSDLKIPHMRNLYTKFGPRFGTPAAPGDQKSGFGITHDGAIPDLNTFLSAGVFQLTADDVKNISAFAMMFPTGMRPAVGRNLTLPPGAPPTGTAQDEALLATLIASGTGRSEPSLRFGGGGPPVGSGRERTWFLNGGAPGGLEHRRRRRAPGHDGKPAHLGGGPITFTCATPGSGIRFAPIATRTGPSTARLRPGRRAVADPGPVTNVKVDATGQLLWDAQVSLDPTPITHDVAGADLSTVPANGFNLAGCLAGDRDGAVARRARQPAVGDGYYYEVRARKPCGSAGFAPAAPLSTLTCSP